MFARGLSVLKHPETIIISFVSSKSRIEFIYMIVGSSD